MWLIGHQVERTPRQPDHLVLLKDRAHSIPLRSRRAVRRDKCAGVSGKVNPNTTVYANASYQSRFDGAGFAYSGKAGLRVNW